MSAEDFSVAGRRFRTRADYEAALRDQKRIEQIKAAFDPDDPGQLFELLRELKSGAYKFESILGTDFDDEIYDKCEALKKQGIPAENTEKKKPGKVKNPENIQAKKKERKQKASKTKEPADKQATLDGLSPELQRQVLLELKKRENRRKMIIIAASLVAIICFGYFGTYYYFGARTNKEYDQLAGLKGSQALVNTNKNQKGDGLFVHHSDETLPDILDEYKTLYEKNKKLIGWLKIDDTNIDYPVMQTSDNEYYLDHNYHQEYDRNGSIFLDCSCSIYPRSTNLILYGHHMKSGNMFGKLQQYAKQSYGEKHALIQFDTIYEKATYQVMFVFRSQVFNEDDAVFKYYQFIEANSESEFTYYMNEMAALSLYDTGVEASYGDSLLTLSTCDSSQTDGRFVVVAKRIS